MGTIKKKIINNKIVDLEQDDTTGLPINAWKVKDTKNDSEIVSKSTQSKYKISNRNHKEITDENDFKEEELQSKVDSKTVDPTLKPMELFKLISPEEADKKE